MHELDKVEQSINKQIENIFASGQVPEKTKNQLLGSVNFSVEYKNSEIVIKKKKSEFKENRYQEIIEKTEKFSVSDFLKTFSKVKQNQEEGNKINGLENIVENQENLEKIRGLIIKSFFLIEASAEFKNKIKDLSRDYEAFQVSKEQQQNRLATNEYLSSKATITIPKVSYGVSLAQEAGASIAEAASRLWSGGKVDKNKTLFKATSERDAQNASMLAEAVKKPLETLASPVTFVAKLASGSTRKNTGQSKS